MDKHNEDACGWQSKHYFYLEESTKTAYFDPGERPPSARLSGGRVQSKPPFIPTLIDPIPPYSRDLSDARLLPNGPETDRRAGVTDGILSQQVLNHVSHLSIEPMPRATTYLTNGYLQALKNRMVHSDLLPGMRLDARKYVPVFVYDVMMMPGSLSRMLRKSSETDQLERMTPGLLPGFRAVVDPVSKQPALIPSSMDCVRGIVLFGQGKNGRTLVQTHYREHTTARVRPHVCIETLVPQPKYLRKTAEKWQRQRTTIRADTWIWTVENLQHQPDLQTWDLESFLSGEYHEVQ